MDHGRLLTLDTPEALTRSLPGSQTLDVTVALDGTDPGEFVGALGRLDGVQDVERTAAEDAQLAARLYVAGDASALMLPLARLVDDRGVHLSDVSIGRPSLEDVFISLTGRALR
jgi:ABC-2 type transport system ATP-binding protein